MSRNLLVRLAFAVPAIAFTLLVLWVGTWPLAVFIAALSVLGTAEVYDLARKRGIHPLAPLGLFAAAASPFATLWGKHYAGSLLAFRVAMRHGPHSDAHPRGSFALALLPLVITWVCDTAAMAAGTLVGGPKLAPVLSPRKTWAGAIAGVVGAVAAALAYGALVLARVPMGLTVWQLVVAAIVIAVVAAQFGDVAESLFKREAGVKDSSALIPGHGGVLDRLDSLYFVLPVTAGLFRLFGVA
jgi:phosphatidate cytidylyltransferase